MSLQAKEGKVRTTLFQYACSSQSSRPIIRHAGVPDDICTHTHERLSGVGVVDAGLRHGQVCAVLFKVERD